MNNVTNGKKKIILVDDNDIHLTTAEMFLKDEYEIYKATSGDEALKYLYDNKFTPDLIMLDILMPNMDGWEVFNRIRAIGVLRSVPIVFVTSLEGDNEKKRAHDLGAADYITKPYNMTELKSRIGEVIKNKQK